MQKTSKYIYSKRLFRTYLKGKYLNYFGGIAALLVTIVLTAVMPQVIQKAIDLLNKYDGSIEVKSQLRITALIIFAIGVILCLVRSLSRILIFIPGRQIENELRKDFFEATSSLEPKEISKYDIGDLISRGTNDMSSIRIMVSMGVLHTLNSSFMIVLCLYFMMQTSLKMTMLTLLPVPLLILGTNLISKKMLEYSRKTQRQLGELSESTRELIRAYDLFSIFDILPFVRTAFDKDNNNYLNSSILLGKSRIYLLAITIGVTNLTTFILIYFAGKFVLDEQLTVGQFVAFELYVAILVNPLRAVGWLVSALQRGEICLARIFPLIDLAKQYKEEQSKKKITTEEEFDKSHIKDAPLIQVNNLKFNYNSNAQNRFNVKVNNLTITQGKKYGIFGKTGSGKSTLLKILAGKIECNQGTLLLKGIPYKDINEETLNGQFSFVFQENQHFIGSIEDNLQDIVSSGNKQTNKSHISIEDAYKMSSLSNDIDVLPDKETTVLGEFGLNLSGGQKQRLALARALIYPSHVLFLDDFISAVDHKTEEIIIKNIFTKLQHTIILTSHRISALKNCDEIWVMEDGEITDKSNHQELIKKGGEYATIYRYQQFESKSTSESNL